MIRNNFALPWEAKSKDYARDIWGARNSGRIAAFAVAQSTLTEFSGFGNETTDFYASRTEIFRENEAFRTAASIVGADPYSINQKRDRVS